MFSQNHHHRNSFKSLLGVTGLVLIEEVQTECFQDDITDLKKPRVVKDIRSLKTLNPLLVANVIIRVRGRTDAAEIPYDASHPMLLPKHQAPSSCENPSCY